MSTPFYDLASLVVVPSGYKSGKIYAQKPLTTDGQLTFTRASTATRVTSTGALETVASGVPRLDYTNSSCPKILLEPQRTQKLLHNNDFSQVGAWALAYQGLATAPVLTANYGTDPFGGTNAWRIQLNLNGGTDGSSRSWMLQNFNPSATVTLSMYIKLNTAGSKTVILSDSGGTTVTVNSTSWTRISQVQIGGGGEFRFGLIGGMTSDTLDASICYAQSEEGSYATSIINSTSAAVTRLADAASKTGISSLMGQTEGTIFYDFVFKTGVSTTNGQFGIANASGTDRVIIWNNFSLDTLALQIKANNVNVAANSVGTFVDGTTYKIAVAYKSGSVAVYVNGVSVYTSSASFTFANSLTEFYLGTYELTGMQPHQKVNQALLFKTRLTNAQLAELTTL